MTATSAASTLGESWNRRHPVSTESFAPQAMDPQPMAEGLRFAPPALATRAAGPHRLSRECQTCVGSFS